MHKRIAIIIVLLLTLCRPTINAARRALLIGISTYPKHEQAQLDWRNIHGANDIAIISSTLKHQGFAVTTLANRQANAKSIRHAFARLEGQTHTGDLVYIQFSGHGQPYEDRNGDEADGWDEAIVPYDAGKRYIANVYDGRNHIIDDELNVYITNIRKKAGTTGFVYVVLDACHMGGASRGEEEDEDSVFVRGTSVGFSRTGKPFIPKIDSRPVIRIPKGTGMAGTCYLEACRSYQSNTEIKEGSRYYGPLSYYINKVLAATRLTANTSWVEKVRALMRSDRRLTRQNMVTEVSSR